MTENFNKIEKRRALGARVEGPAVELSEEDLLRQQIRQRLEELLNQKFKSLNWIPRQKRLICFPGL